MYTRILTVDDELLSRNRLHNLIDWERNGYIIVGEAEDGLEAIQFIEKFQPHIIILDIDMPLMDGVSLCKYINENHKEMETIILSNYDHFEYVRDTLNSGAVDYLLKHRVSQDQLLQVLHKAEVKLKNKSRHQSFNTYGLQLNSNSSLNSKHLTQILLQSSDFSQLEKTNSSTSKEFTFYQNKTVVIVMQLLNDCIWVANNQRDNLQIFYNSVADLCQQLIGDLSKGCVDFIGQNRFVFILSYSEFNSEAPILQSIRSFLDKVSSSMQLIYNAPITIINSSICYNPTMIPSAFHDVCKQLDNNFRAVNNLPKRPSALHSDVPITLSISQEKELLAAIVIYSTSKIDAIIDEIYDNFAQNTDNHSQIYFLIEDMINIAHRVGKKGGADVSWISQDLIRNSPESGQIQDIKSWMKSIFRRLTGEINLLDLQNKYSKHVAEAMKLIRTRYSEDLTQEEAAAIIGITPSYLSKIFKEETGMSFIESINYFKVELSKQYMESGDKKIKEIYQLTGFNSYSYFFKVFKEIVGETPHSYAKKFKYPIDLDR
jgi:two-component system response regulator YesN